MTDHSSAPVVLVVDDDRDIRGTLGHVLEEEGYATAGAWDGSEALRLLRAGLRPCVIFLTSRGQAWTAGTFWPTN